MINPHPILIVEDDQDDCDLIVSALKAIDVRNETKFFRNGEEVLKYLRSNQVPTFLILSDVNMPKINGFELKNEINKDRELKKQSIPFIFLSTSATVSEVSKAYDMMVQGFFKKPDTFEGIKDILKTIINYWDSAKHPNSFALS